MAQNKTLPTLPSLPSVYTIRETRACFCGCGLNTQRTFCPGHDARLKAIVIRVVRGVMTLEEVEAWGGKATRKATEAVIGSKSMLARWNIEVPVVEKENVG